MRRTKVSALYRTPYTGTKVPPDELEIMKDEIQHFRTDLLTKQTRLSQSKYSSDMALVDYLRSDKTKTRGKSDREIQNIWNRLYSMEKNKNNSISGKKDIEVRTLKSLHNQGLDFVNQHNLRTFGEFMNWAKDTYGVIMDSHRIAQFYFNNQGLSPSAIRQQFNIFVDNGVLFNLDEKGYEEYLTTLAQNHYDSEKEQLSIYDFYHKSR